MEYAYEYNYEYPVESGMSDSLFAAIMSIYLIIIIVALIFWIVEYLFRGIGLYTIGKRMGKNYPWLAFIPFARKYMHGDLAGTIPLKTKQIKSPGVWKLVLPIISGIAGFIFYFIFVAVFGVGILSGISYSYGGYSSPSIGGGTVFVLVILLLLLAVGAIFYQAVYGVLTALINFQIYGRFTTRNMAIAHSVLSSLVPLYESFCMFALRNRDFNPGMEPRLTPPPVQPVYPGYTVPPTTPGMGQPVPPAAPEAPMAGQPVPPAAPEAPVSEQPMPAAAPEAPVSEQPMPADAPEVQDSAQPDPENKTE